MVKLIRELPDSRGFLFLDVHKMLSFAHGKVTESAARTALAEEMIKVRETMIVWINSHHLSSSLPRPTVCA